MARRISEAEQYEIDLRTARRDHKKTVAELIAWHAEGHSSDEIAWRLRQVGRWTASAMSWLEDDVRRALHRRGKIPNEVWASAEGENADFDRRRESARQERARLAGCKAREGRRRLAEIVRRLRKAMALFLAHRRRALPVLGQRLRVAATETRNARLAEAPDTAEARRAAVGRTAAARARAGMDALRDRLLRDVGPLLLAMRDHGCGPSTMAAELERRGVPTRRGGAWSRDSVNDLLGVLDRRGETDASYRARADWSPPPRPSRAEPLAPPAWERQERLLPPAKPPPSPPPTCAPPRRVIIRKPSKGRPLTPGEVMAARASDGAARKAREIRERALAVLATADPHLSPEKAAVVLNAAGIVTAHGKRWSRSTVGAMFIRAEEEAAEVRKKQDQPPGEG